MKFESRPLQLAGSEILPGPTEYDPKLVKDGTPRISIGLPIPSPFKKDAPAPNVYVIKSGIGTKSLTEPASPEVLVRSRSFVGSPYHTTQKACVPGQRSLKLITSRETCRNVSLRLNG